MPKAYKNIEMERMIAALKKHLGRTDMIGYAAARNTRILLAESQEYQERREELIRKYGKPETDENGKNTGRIKLLINSPEFADYEKEISEWAMIEHTPPIYKISAEEVIGKLSGSEILEIDWMLKDFEDESETEDAG